MNELFTYTDATDAWLQMLATDAELQMLCTDTIYKCWLQMLQMLIYATDTIYRCLATDATDAWLQILATDATDTGPQMLIQMLGYRCYSYRSWPRLGLRFLSKVIVKFKKILRISNKLKEKQEQKHCR